MQAKDLSNQSIIDAVRASIAIRSAASGRQWSWASRWDIAVQMPHVPEKVVLTKLRKLVRAGVLGGCACGCRGDFDVIEDRA